MENASPCRQHVELCFEAASLSFKGTKVPSQSSVPSGSPCGSSTALHGLLSHNHSLVWPSSEFQGKLEYCFELKSPAYFSVTCAAFSPVHLRDVSRCEVLSSASHRRMKMPSGFPLLSVTLSLKGEGPSYNQRLWGPAGDRVPSWRDLYEQTGE